MHCLFSPLPTDFSLPSHLNSLNAGQNKALNVLRTKSDSLIQGYPGAGKSRMIGEIVRACSENH